MRWFHMALIAVLAAVTLIFAFQNLQSVTVAFLGFRLSAPLTILVAVVYVLGMADRRQPVGAVTLGAGRIEGETAGDIDGERTRAQERPRSRA